MAPTDQRRARVLLVNGLTAARLVLSPALPLLAGHLPAALALYTLGRLTDLADGYLARRWQVASRPGARLDSAADLVFWLCMAGWLARSMGMRLAAVLPWAGAALALRLLALAAALWRRHPPLPLHTWANKAAGGLLWLALPLWVAAGWAWLVPVTGLAACLAASEDALLHLTLPTSLDPDTRSLWHAHRARRNR